jgi:hypothetical protein
MTISLHGSVTRPTGVLNSAAPVDDKYGKRDTEQREEKGKLPREINYIN